jgi:hypothetical protein
MGNGEKASDLSTFCEKFLKVSPGVKLPRHRSVEAPQLVRRVGIPMSERFDTVTAQGG